MSILVKMTEVIRELQEKVAALERAIKELEKGGCKCK